MEKTAVFTVIFPGNLKYFDDFLKSLAAQRNSSFDLLLAVDNVPDIDRYLAGFEDHFRIIKKKLSGTIAEIRQQSIEWLCSLSYLNYLFADSDDLFDESRVNVCVEALSSYGVVVNDVVPFAGTATGSPVGYWSGRIKSGHIFTSRNIENFNFAGLGNSAVRKDVLRSMHLPDELVAVDWFLFFHWLQHCEGVFLHNGVVHYRQYAGNIAGLNGLDRAKLLRIASVKCRHYDHLKNDFPYFQTVLEKERRIEKRLREDAAFAGEMVVNINEQRINFYWWEETEYINE